MDDAHAFPNDLAECHGLLLAAFEQASELERVLDQTAASYDELNEVHQATLDELNRLKRWVYGRRRERIVEGEGQRHLFDLEPEASDEPDPSIPQPPEQQVAAHSRRRRRELDLDKLPHYRHELDVSPGDKTCSCCGRTKDCIGQDETKILDYVPPKLEVHVHVRPKYACRYCKNGVVSPPPPQRPIARGIAGRHWRFVSHAANDANQRSVPESCCRRQKPASPGRGSSLRSSSANSAIICRCTGRKTSSPATGCTLPVALCAIGSRRPRNC